MRTKIYQINSKRDVNRVKFEGLELLERYQSSAAVDPSIYDEVFNAEIDETDLEAIYQRFNTIGHPLHRGHSLSVSDVVVNDNGAFFCDSIGFQPIAFDESQTQKPDNLMRVVYVEPHKAPYIADVAHTLEAEQKAVGDDIPVNRHLAEVGADPLGGELSHLLFNQSPFLRCHRAAKKDRTLSVHHSGYLRFS